MSDQLELQPCRLASGGGLTFAQRNWTGTGSAAVSYLRDDAPAKDMCSCCRYPEEEMLPHAMRLWNTSWNSLCCFFGSTSKSHGAIMGLELGVCTLM